MYKKTEEYNKKKTLEAFDMYTDEVLNSNQHMASFICVKNSDKSREIINEYLSVCEQHELLLDVDEVEKLEQHQDFIDHRHDQAIWSLVVKKHNIKTLPPPCQWGVHHGETTEDEVFIYHHRKKQ